MIDFVLNNWLTLFFLSLVATAVIAIILDNLLNSNQAKDVRIAKLEYELAALRTPTIKKRFHTILGLEQDLLELEETMRVELKYGGTVKVFMGAIGYELSLNQAHKKPESPSLNLPSFVKEDSGRLSQTA